MGEIPGSGRLYDGKNLLRRNSRILSSSGMRGEARFWPIWESGRHSSRASKRAFAECSQTTDAAEMGGISASDSAERRRWDGPTARANLKKGRLGRVLQQHVRLGRFESETKATKATSSLSVTSSARAQSWRTKFCAFWSGIATQWRASAAPI
jgi:hypothetical protein